MKMNKWILVAALVLSVAMATTGTMAYLTSTDSDVNVMTLGKVDIEQNEQKIVDGELADFEQFKPLLPAVYDGDEIATNANLAESGTEWSYISGNKNVVDKFVTVTNKGKIDAYVRTIILYEGDKTTRTKDEKAPEIIVLDNEIEGVLRVETYPEAVTVNGVKYTAVFYTYEEPVKAGTTTVPSLKQVYMANWCDNAEVGAYGDTYDILVLSQAVQADGFEDETLDNNNVKPAVNVAMDAAFGDPFADHETEAGKKNIQVWFEGLKFPVQNEEAAGGDDDSVDYPIPEGIVEVGNTTELLAALSEGETDILLKNGEYEWKSNVADVVNAGAAKNKTLNLYGESKSAVLYMTKEGGEGADYDFDGSNVTFTGLTISSKNYTSNGNYYPGWARMEATYNDCVIDQMYVLYKGTQTFNYCTLNVSGDKYNIWTWGADDVTFNNCTFNTDGKAVLVYNQSCNVKVNNCVFNDSESLTPVKAAIETGADSINQGVVKHNIEVTNTKVNGFAVNTTSCSDVTTTLWANKNGLDKDHLNVVVDGVEVY